MENKKRLIDEEITINMEKMKKAEAIAKLDNKSSVSPETRLLLEKMVAGEMTGDEIVNEIIKRYKNRSSCENL